MAVAKPLLGPVVGFILLLAAWLAQAAAPLDRLAPPPGPRDLCPVCGMVVAKYPAWIASVAWKDGHTHHFDGAKDMFKFLFELKKYAPGHEAADLRALAVTEYYGLTRIDATRAFYVIGSDVLGPMGHELVPLASRADAEEFLKGHRGRRILTYPQVTRGLVMGLDAGRFDR